jgi:ferredoxin-NADP reductase
VLPARPGPFLPATPRWWADPGSLTGGLGLLMVTALWVGNQFAGLGDGDALRRFAPGIARSQVYLCGPHGWTEAARAAARSAGVDPHCLHTERFTW